MQISKTAAQSALTKTLLGTHTVQAATFNDRVRATIAEQQDVAKRGSKAGTGVAR